MNTYPGEPIVVHVPYTGEPYHRDGVQVDDVDVAWSYTITPHQQRTDTDMTVQVGCDDNVDDRYRRWHDMELKGRCTYCRPHRGENRGGEDGKFYWDEESLQVKFRPSKGKDRK